MQQSLVRRERSGLLQQFEVQNRVHLDQYQLQCGDGGKCGC